MISSRLSMREGAVEEDLAGVAALGVFGMMAGEGLEFFGTPFPLAEAEVFAIGFLVLMIHKYKEIEQHRTEVATN